MTICSRATPVTTCSRAARAPTCWAAALARTSSTAAPATTRWSRTRRRRSRSGQAAASSGLMLFQRSHRQARFPQLLPVELGRLPWPRPDSGLTAVVDLVGEAIAGVEGDAGDHARQGLGDVIERVVVVVEHDHEPVTAQPLLGTGRLRALNRGRGHPAEDKGSGCKQRTF